MPKPITMKRTVKKTNICCKKTVTKIANVKKQKAKVILSLDSSRSFSQGNTEFEITIKETLHIKLEKPALK